MDRVSDSTSEYNRCYIKELDRARQKQKKSTRGGRCRTPKYNAFSSTTKCYERLQGRSKITVRLSTDGSMLEIEQYDVEYNPTDELISDSTTEDMGILMKPVGMTAMPVNGIKNKRFSYGRSDSAPLLKTDIITGECDASDCVAECSYSSVCRRAQISNSSLFIDDSINGAISKLETREHTGKDSTKVVVNVHDTKIQEHELVHDHLPSHVHELNVMPDVSVNPKMRAEHPTCWLHEQLPGQSNTGNRPKDDDSGDRHINNRQRNGITEQFSECKEDGGNSNSTICGRCGLKDNMQYQHVCIYRNEQCERQSVITGADEHSCKTYIKTETSSNDIPMFKNEERATDHAHNLLADGFALRLVPRSTSNNCVPENKHALDSEISTYTRDDTIKRHEQEGREKCIVHGNRQELIEKQTAADRFLSCCFVCEKDKWNNGPPFCVCINNKCRMLKSPGRQGCDRDFNANMCYSRRHALKVHGKNMISQLNIDNDGVMAHLMNLDSQTHTEAFSEHFSAHSMDCKQGEKIPHHQNEEIGPKRCVLHDLDSSHNGNEANQINANIDFPEKKLCLDVSGQQTFCRNSHVSVYPDNHKVGQSTGKSMRAHSSRENWCPENRNINKCMEKTLDTGETVVKVDKFKSVSMATNYVSDNTLGDVGKLRCNPQESSSVAESKLTGNGTTTNWYNGKMRFVN